MAPVPPEPPPRPRWQPILGAALLIVGLIVGVVAILALRDPTGQRSPTGQPQAPASGEPSATAAPTSSGADAPRASVVVLNNTSIQGLAASTGQLLTDAGWTVTSTSNYSNDIISTAAYYDPSDPANQAAATPLQAEFPWIARVVPRFEQLPPSPIVLIVTAAY